MLENANVLTAAIAFSGVIVSVSASLLITFLSTRSEIRKLKTSLRNQYASLILEKRIEVYKECYYLLSHFAKHAQGYIKQGTPLAYEDIVYFNEKLSDWDSKNAILMSSASSHLIYRLRGIIQQSLKEINEKNVGADELDGVLASMVKHSKKLEMSLRNDIGIYEVEKYEDRRYIFSNYKFIRDHVPGPEVLLDEEIGRKAIR